MKKLNTILKFSAVIFSVLIMASCSLDKEEPLDFTPNTPEIEAQQIKTWLDTMKSRNNHVYTLMDGTDTLLYYIKMDSIGTGDVVKEGDKLTVKYIGMFLNGVSFDSSQRYTYFHKDPDPNKRMIEGWEKGIELLKKGESYAFLLPSDQAYGSRGSSGVIPPYTPLIFVIEVLDIQ